MSDVKIIVSADTKKGRAAIKSLDQNIDKLEKTSKRAAGGFKGLSKQFAVGMAAAYGVIKSLKKLTDWTKDAIEKASIQEDAEKSLEAALESTGRQTSGLADHFKRYASELQRATRYGDEQIINAQSLLIQLTNLDRMGLDAAMKGALGLATVYGTDLFAATTLVGKALAGNYGALSRYGIVVERTASDEEKRVSVLEQLTTMYGRAEAATDTYAGRMDQLKNTYGDLKEEVGKVITGSESFRKGIEDIEQTIRNLIDSGIIAAWAEQIAGILGKHPLINMIAEGFKYMGKKAAEAVEEKKRLNAQFEAFKKLLGPTAEGVMGLINNFSILFPFQRIVTKETEAMNIEFEEQLALYEKMKRIRAGETPAQKFLAGLKEFEIPELIKDPQELLKDMPIAEAGEYAKYEFEKSMAGAEEAQQNFIDTSLASVGCYTEGVKVAAKEREEAEISTFEAIGTAAMIALGDSKAGAVAGAIMSTYAGAAKTIEMLGMPWAIPFVALAILTGMKQVAAIMAVPVPSAAEGAFIPQDTLVQAHRGELLAPQPMLRETFREVIREREGGGQPIYITLENHMAGQKISEAHWKITNEGFRRGKIRVRNMN